MSRPYQSLPVRGAWVEISGMRWSAGWRRCRSPCGERGLKSNQAGRFARQQNGRSPCGERGLKSFNSHFCCIAKTSLPVRGAWVEMWSCARNRSAALRSLPVRGAWVEIT